MADAAGVASPAGKDSGQVRPGPMTQGDQDCVNSREKENA